MAMVIETRIERTTRNVRLNKSMSEKRSKVKVTSNKTKFKTIKIGLA